MTEHVHDGAYESETSSDDSSYDESSVFDNFVNDSEEQQVLNPSESQGNVSPNIQPPEFHENPTGGVENLEEHHEYTEHDQTEPGDDSTDENPQRSRKRYRNLLELELDDWLDPSLPRLYHLSETNSDGS
jgi:hypothetical protein